MKYIILVGDGMPDMPLAELGGKTPLEAAKTPNMDSICSSGICGSANFVPETLQPGSDVANLSLFGYDPQRYFPGRGPLEAASMGVDLKDEDVAFRCNLVTVKNGVMDDYSSGHITTDDAKNIIGELNAKLSDERVKFYSGVSYRHLCVIKNGPRKASCTPPHDITGKKIDKYLPKGAGNDLLNELMQSSVPVLEKSKTNLKRIKGGNKPATMIWLWGQGEKPDMPGYEEKYDLRGSVITAVDLIKGIGVCAGLDIINVPGATGYLDTNYKGKAEYALKSLRSKDFVFVHVESPDETGHNGDIAGKIKAIEDFDNLVVGTILKGLKNFKEFRLLVTADHPTPIPVKTHTRGDVPFAICGTGIKSNGIKKFCEKEAQKSGIKISKGYQLVSDYFLTMKELRFK